MKILIIIDKYGREYVIPVPSSTPADYTEIFDKYKRSNAKGKKGVSREKTKR